MLPPASGSRFNNKRIAAPARARRVAIPFLKDQERMIDVFDNTNNDVFDIYNALKDKYSLLMTNTLALDDGYTVDYPVLVAKAHGQAVRLYVDDGYFVFCVIDEAKDAETHLHPCDTQQALSFLVEFMDGRTDYDF